MKKIVFVFILLATSMVSAQKNIYENIRFDELTDNHEVLAIVPFIAHLELKKAVDRDELKVLAKKEGYAVQNALETYFSKRKKRKKFNVDFQNINNTNAVLAQNNIDYNNSEILLDFKLRRFNLFALFFKLFQIIKLKLIHEKY